MWTIYMVEYNSALKRKEFLSFGATGVKLKGIMLSEISQTEKDKYSWYYLYVKSKKEKKS